MMSSTASDVCARFLAWATAAELDTEIVTDTHVVVQLPGERKLKTTVSLRFGNVAVDAQAFVIRHADENLEQFYAWLLRKNSKLKGVSFSIDKLGDVYLDARVPLAVFEAETDTLLGRILTAADESFNELLVIGFLTSMKREWAWRLARGESTRNLAAFTDLLSGPNNEFIGTFTNTADAPQSDHQSDETGHQAASSPQTGTSPAADSNRPASSNQPGHSNQSANSDQPAASNLSADSDNG